MSQDLEIGTKIPSGWANLVQGHHIVAAIVFLFTLVVYSITLTTSVPFWDSGEFIATSYVLGIPHPPGTPLYVLIGRLFTMVPVASVALMVNWLSAFASALAILFTFLLTVRFIRKCQGPNHTQADEIIAWTGAAAASLFAAFCKTFWDSAIEAEVYALSSWMQVFILWLGLKWWEGLDRGEGDNRLMVAWYLCFLTVGIHLGTFLVLPALLLLVFMVNRRSFVYLFVAGFFLLLPMALTWEPFIKLVYAAFATVLVVLLWKWPDIFKPKNVAWAAALAVVGLSVHAYLYIRAKANPPINEGDPETWESLRALLMRDQYGTRPMLPRSAPWSFQFGMYFRYFMEQYTLHTRLGALAWALPLAFGLFGAVGHFVRDKKTFIVQGVTFFLMSFGLLTYLNFTDHEVRERDYFYTSSFHFFAIWIGMGLAFLVEWLRESVEFFNKRVALIGVSLLVIAVSLMPMVHHWYKHDRRDFFVARDYAYNMLTPLGQNAFVFTNGDNDTFPLWYIQEVEKVRKDIRVINLSLLNTDWYIKQLRDEEPRVPMTVTDAQIERVRTHGYFIDDQTGQPVLVNAYMVQNILDTNAGRQPAYLAVTVPNHHGLDARMVLEGLVYRIEEEPVVPSETIVRTSTNWMDVPIVKQRLYQDFEYRNLFDETGAFLEDPYKDENARRLSQNYAAAHIQLAYHHRRLGDYETALSELERVLRMFPDFGSVRAQIGAFKLEMGDTVGAIAHLEAEAAATNNPDVLYYLGLAYGMQGRNDEAVASFLRAGRLDKTDQQPFLAAASLLNEGGRLEEAKNVLLELLQYQPTNRDAQAYLRSLDTTRQGPWTGTPVTPRTGSGP